LNSPKIVKIILISFGLLLLTFFGLYFGSNWYYSYQDRKFYDLEIPEGSDFHKPIEYLTLSQIDSLENIAVDTNKILIVGTGYTGYDFYMWFKPTEKGELYIKAYEITQGQRLSESKLTNRTKTIVSRLSDNYKLFRGNSVIDEGTFEKYYPTRFELWFKSEINGTERKLTEKSYLIDGWDR
jgi:hypothetical protein